MKPGEYLISETEIEINSGRDTLSMEVSNTGDRPIQVGSHYHFAETNPALLFNRGEAKGFRLDIPAGTAIRFEPGSSRQIELVAFSGKREIYGFRGDVMGKVDS